MYGMPAMHLCLLAVDKIAVVMCQWSRSAV